jgi:exopolyphosphatase/guanosine-5'-triphosphate,3'-diphosphate pyrophosphatase
LITSDFHTSLDVGVVRLTERHGADLEAMAAQVRGALPALRADRVVNVDGTTAEIAHVAGEVTLDALASLLEWLVTAGRHQIRARLLQPDRAGVLPAGVVILRETLTALGVDRTEPSDRDLLNGAALEAAELPEPAEGEAPPGAYTCC